MAGLPDLCLFVPCLVGRNMDSFGFWHCHGFI